MASVNNNTQVAYSYLQYKNKVGGLVSGMDIDSIMEKLMKAESSQMEKLQQQKQKYEWKRDAYRGVNTSLNTFQQDLFDKYGLSNSWISKTVNNSNSSKVSVTAGGAANGTLNIQSATAAKAAASTSETIGAAKTDAIVQQRVNADTKLSNIEGLDLSGNSLVFDVAGQKATVSVASTDTLGDLVNKLNNTKLTIDGVEKNVFKASLQDGKLSISSSLGTITTTDSDTLKNLDALGMRNNTTALGNELKITDVDGNKVAANKNTKLSDLGLAPSGTLSFKIGDKTKTVSYSAEDDTVEKLFAKINATSTGEDDPQLKASINSSGQISITSTAGTVSLDESDIKNQLGFTNKVQTSSRLFEKTTDTTSPNTIQGTTFLKELGFGDSGTFTIRAIQADGKMKDTEIKYNSTDTINALMSKINNSGAGATAIFNNGQMSISANNTGAVADDTGAEAVGKAEVSLLNYNIVDGSKKDNDKAVDLFTKLGVKQTANSDGEITLAEGGSSATLKVNGVEYKGASNTFSIAGYTVQLKEDILESDKVSISSTTDVDSTIGKVKEFVNMYNDLIKSLNSKTSEKRNVNYDPLTDAQKAEMTTDQITKWEEMAKAGIIKGDSNINSVLSQMRTILNGGKGSETLYNIGITTSSTWSDNGKLVVDENKLREALDKDPDVLSRIFVGTTDDPGMVGQLRTAAKNTIKNIEKTAGKDSQASNQYSLGKTINSLGDKISDWKARLKTIEERYWNQFSAMENAIQKANKQSSIFGQ
ncbi:flagellar filament capping protein FliD [Rummeliibacillus pycnus]|uniref:flagellar filament capping protein FliD n=1 Tax=Rummeliibacillus pycnus TaxID=101070 RepID=UPI0037CBF00E